MYAPHPVTFYSRDVFLTHENSIVAVHGLDEAKLDTWTDPRTNILWLRDLFPYEQLNVRILAYGYEAENLSSSRDSTADRTLPYATTLIAALCAERELSNASE